MKLNLLITLFVLISYQCYNKPETNALNTKTFEIGKKNDAVLINKNTPKIADNTEVDRDELVVFAKTLIGTPYIYAKQDPKIGFDCSGFVNYVFKNFDIAVPRTSSDFKNFGKKINIEEIKLGDVIVFKSFSDSAVIGHLGIVCEADGFNSKFIHASSGKTMQVVISDLNSTHYSKRFHHAVDVIND